MNEQNDNENSEVSENSGGDTKKATPDVSENVPEFRMMIKRLILVNTVMNLKVR